MKLNHINLLIADVPAAINLFVTCFGFTLTETKGDNVIAVLNGTDDFVLVLMKQKEGAPVYPQGFHVGFLQDSKEAVLSVFEKLKAFGIELTKEPAKIRESFGFYFSFDSVMIEVGYYGDGE